MTSVSPGPPGESPSWRRITPGQKSMAHSPFSAGREARSAGSRGMWRPALLSVPTSDSVWGGVGACNSRGGEDESHLGQGRWTGKWVRKGRSQGAYGTTTREEGVLGRQSRMISGKAQVKAGLSKSVPASRAQGNPTVQVPSRDLSRSGFFGAGGGPNQYRPQYRYRSC